ncbi:hypothetical protein FRC19_001680 [Serendipita sp. 401]|nr:hypothetical protein FRC19_001680 [Serendipita sp. 401]
MEKLPAVYRVPTELWHEIFSHILKTWLLPGSGDNVFDNIFLFSHGYKSRAEYSRFESDRRKLGAVCRHWKAVADDFALNMVFTNFGKSAPISKERLDLSQRIEVANGCLCSQHPFKLCVIPPIQHGRDGVTAYKPVLDSPFSLEHVQVISSGAPTCFGRFIDANVEWSLNSLSVDETINFFDLQQYRRLEVLGITTIYGLSAVGGINEPSTVDISLPPLSLLLSDIGNLPGCPDAQKIAEQYLSLATHPTAIFDKIVMTNSWSEVIQEWETCVANGMQWTSRSWRGISPLDHPREFFRAVSKTNNVFVDKDGIDLREGDGLKILETLGLTDLLETSSKIVV